MTCAVLAADTIEGVPVGVPDECRSENHGSVPLTEVTHAWLSKIHAADAAAHAANLRIAVSKYCNQIDYAAARRVRHRWAVQKYDAKLRKAGRCVSCRGRARQAPGRTTCTVCAVLKRSKIRALREKRRLSA